MNLPTDIADDIFSRFKAAKRVLIISHRGPDPDTLGSNLALRKVLEDMGKHVTSACVDEVPHTYHIVPDLKTFITDFNPKEYDLFIAVDAGSISQANFPLTYPEIVEKNFINIDHHPSNEGYGTTNLVMDKAASATFVIYHLFKYWKIEITPYLATLLLYGLYYDTGSFMHSNTCDAVLEMASELLILGADQELITKSLYQNKTVNQLRLWGRALENMELTNNNVAVAAVTEDDFKAADATHNDLSGLIDYVSSTKGSHFATLLSSQEDGTIKGSFRTRRDDVNVSALAQNFGGGGHKKASGFNIKGKIKRTSQWSIVGE